MGAYRAPTSASGYDLLFTDSSGNTRHSFDVSKNLFELKPSPALPSSIYQIQNTPDGKFIAVSMASAPFFQIWRRESDGSYSKTDIENLPALSAPGYGRSISIDDSGKIFFTARSTRTYSFEVNADKSGYIYKQNFAFGGDNGCVSPNGMYFSVAGSNSLNIYKWNGTTFIYTSPASFNGSDVNTPSWLEWSKNSNFLFASFTASNNSLMMWSRVNDVFTRTRSMATGGGLRDFRISPDQSHIVSYGAAANNTKLHLFKWDGAASLVSITIPQPAALPTGISFSEDGKYLAMGLTQQTSGSNTNFQGKLYARTGDIYQVIPNNLQTNTTFGAKVWFLSIPS